MIKSVDELLKAAKKGQKMKLAVAAAQDAEVLTAVCEAAREGLVEPVLVGDEETIKDIAAQEKLNIENYRIVTCQTLSECAEVAVKMVSANEADFLMKGLIDTSILLKAVLNKDYGLRTDSLLSHVMVYDVPTYHKLLFMTDGGMNISPLLEDKKKIVQNAVDMCRALGIEEVKIAGLAAKEKVNPKMQATVDARALQDASQAGEFGQQVIVEGPLALDLALSEKAAKVKHFNSKVAGEVDVILVPTIEVGNGIGKALTYLAGAKSAGVIMGAKVPIVLVSRADSSEDKLHSIALGSVIAANMNK